MARARALLLAACAIGATVGVVTPFVARAVPGGAMTTTDGTFFGTSGDDVLVIARDSTLLTHNRFGAGDPGFASASDFDSGVTGVQTKAADAQRLSFGLGAGNDTVPLVGTFPFPFYSGDFGADADTIDATNYVSAANSGLGLGGSFVATLKTVKGTQYNDHVHFPNSSNPGPVTVLLGDGDDYVWATDAADTLDLGAGNNEIHAEGGDDVVAVEAPFPPTITPIDTGTGNNSLIFRGTPAGDDLATFQELEHGALVAAEAARPDGGYSFSSGTAVRFELGGGDDDLFVDPHVPTTVDGGAGNDAITLDAHAGTAQVQTNGDTRVVTVPAQPARAPLAITLAATESLSVLNETLLATAPGAGGGPHVRTFRIDGTPVASFFAYAPNFAGGVDVALGDLDGDRDDEIITGAGPGGAAHVRVFHSDGTDAGVSFFAYDTNFHGGVNVAAIDLDGDGFDEIVTAPAQGGGPHVRIWSGDGELLDEWLADGFPSNGLHVARGGDLAGGGAQWIVLASAAGATAMSDVFQADGSPAPGYLTDEPFGNFSGGMSISRGNFALNPQYLSYYHDSLVMAAGPGGGPHVKVRHYGGSVDGEPLPPDEIASFFAYDAGFRGGVNVTVCDPDGIDDEIVTAPGPGGGPHVRMFDRAGAPLALSFFAYGADFRGGVHVACGGAETKAY